MNISLIINEAGHLKEFKDFLKKKSTKQSHSDAKYYSGCPAAVRV